MKFFWLLSLIVEMHAWAGGNIPIMFIPGRQTRLNFSTSIQSVGAQVCSGAVTMQNVNSGSVPTNVASTLTISLTGSSGMTFYSDSNCTASIASAAIATSTSSITYYFIDTSIGAASITASATNYQTVTQAETIVTNAFTWTGAAGDNVWSTAGNWSGGAAPSSTQTAFFDGTSCPTFCSPNITANLSVGGVRILAAYAGTITQNSGKTITVGTYGWTQYGGTFVGSSTADNFTMPVSNFYLSGGSFMATAGTTYSGTNNTAVKWTITGSSTFNHNNGTVAFGVLFNLTNTVVPGTSPYYNVTITAQANSLILSNTMTVAKNLTIGSPGNQKMVGGQINVAGNVYVVGLGAPTTATTATVINLNGTGSQSIDATGATTGNLPTVNISSTGGTVSLLGTILINGSYKLASGSLSAGTSSVTFSSTFDNATTIAFASETFNNLTLTGSNVTMAASGAATVSGNLTFNSTTSLALNGGTLNALGDVITTGNGAHGTMQINVAGSTNQKIDASGATSGYLPEITIASTSGTVSLFGTILYSVNWIVNSGTISAGTSTVSCGLGWGTFTPGTGVTYNNVNLTGTSGATFLITGNLTASGNITFGSGAFAVTANMPNPGTGYTLSTGGTLTVASSATLNLHGATRTQASTAGTGTINP
jgi:hypothetical protein